MRLAVLDVGSNTINLQIVNAHHGAPPVSSDGYKTELRLTEYLDEKNFISEIGIRELIRSIKQAIKETKAFSADEILAFATSALREAENSTEVISRVNSEAGIELQVLTGIEEARFTFLAARRWCGWSAGDLLVVDIGGGSLEIARGSHEEPTYLNSFLLGAGRLTRDFLKGDPYSGKSLEELLSYVQRELKPLSVIAGEPKMKMAVGTSKTLRTLAKISKSHLPKYGNHLALPALEEIVPRMMSMTNKQRLDLPGISPSRAPQIVAGAIVALEVMKKLEIQEIQICPWALREGIVLQRLDWLKS